MRSRLSVPRTRALSGQGRFGASDTPEIVRKEFLETANTVPAQCRASRGTRFLLAVRGNKPWRARSRAAAVRAHCRLCSLRRITPPRPAETVERGVVVCRGIGARLRAPARKTHETSQTQPSPRPFRLRRSRLRVKGIPVSDSAIATDSASTGLSLLFEARQISRPVGGRVEAVLFECSMSSFQPARSDISQRRRSEVGSTISMNALLARHLREILGSL